MAKQTYEATEKIASLFPWTMPMMTGVGPDALARTGEAWQRAATAWQQEMFRFTSDRLQKDSEVTREYLGCRGWEDLAKLQQRWLTSTAEDYGGVMSRMGEIARGFGRDVEETSRGAAQKWAEESRSAAAAARRVAE